jgi:hypothetical protein
MTLDGTASANGFVHVLVGRVGDKTVFTIEGNPATASDQPRAHAVLVHLDRSASMHR